MVDTTTLAGILAASGGSVKAPNTSNAGLVKTSAKKPKVTTPKVTAPKVTTPTPTATPAPVSTPDAGSADDGSTDANLTIESAYSPLLDYFKQQAAQMNDRYSKNAANITNIFGTLSDVRKQDIPKIQQQYATSLAQQQEGVAQRMAMQNAEAQAGRQGAATAAGELGSGGMPVPTSSATGAAYTASNTDANAYQTTWNALQQVMSAQQQENVRTSMEGYDYQKVATLEGLQKDLEDRLMQISGNTAQVQSDIAQAKVGAQQSMAATQADLASRLAVQGLKNEGTANVANIRAGATTAAAQSRAAGSGTTATTKPKTYPATIQGWEAQIRDNGGDAGVISSIKLNVENAMNKVIAELKKASKQNDAYVPPKTSDTSFKQAVWKKYLALYGNDQSKTMAQPYVQQYIMKYLGW